MTQIKIKKEVFELKLLNKTAYNEMILAQEDTVFFQIPEEAKTKANSYIDARQAWMKLSIKFDPTTGASKTIKGNKISRCKLDYVTKKTKNVSPRLNSLEDTYNIWMYKLMSRKL